MKKQIVIAFPILNFGLCIFHPVKLIRFLQGSFKNNILFFKTVLLFFMLFNGINSFAQNNLLILNGAYINLKGGTSATNIYIVIAQSSTLGIVRNSGHIISEGQYNYVKWNAGTATGNYVFPFGFGITDYIPFTFNKTNGNDSISISTWTTDQQNIPHPGNSNVTAVSSMTGTQQFSE